ncbi:hypothetical protein HRbin30_00706 [bacterium HR30]|nr:hypothetical protein HRbin30_00706 [bacterium HR30]
MASIVVILAGFEPFVPFLIGFVLALSFVFLKMGIGKSILIEFVILPATLVVLPVFVPVLLFVRVFIPVLVPVLVFLPVPVFNPLLIVVLLGVEALVTKVFVSGTMVFVL